MMSHTSEFRANQNPLTYEHEPPSHIKHRPTLRTKTKTVQLPAGYANLSLRLPTFC